MNILKTIWNFIQNQILGMKWLHELTSRGITALGLDVESRLGGIVHFFIYDTIKIILLLCTLIFTISYIQTHFPPERTKRILSRFSGLLANTISALLGTVTPFCSCSSIPIFIGFTSAGLPLGVTFSFLISSPLVDLGSLILLSSILGFRVALLYVIVGLILAIIGGTIIEKLNLEDQIEPISPESAAPNTEQTDLTTQNRLSIAWKQMVATFLYVVPYILLGVFIGALIHNLIPQTFVETLLGKRNPFSVILATLVGMPMYADIFGTIPVAESLYLQGAGLGTILAFMMAVTAVSLPSMIMLRKVVKPKLLAIFFSIVLFGIMLIGYFFNYFQDIIIGI